MNNKFIPYGKQIISQSDIDAVVDVLQSDWLTTGPKVIEFEKSVAEYTGSLHGVAVSSGTAALHCAMKAIGIHPGDEVIVPAITFAATASAVVLEGGTPVFADVHEDTLLIDVVSVESLVTKRTKAIVAVDYAGQPCDYKKLQKVADKFGLVLVADSCHAIGAEFDGKKVGSLADITVFSFHPVKQMTTGEGGMAVTDNQEYAHKMRLARNHGINSDFRERERKNDWYYEVIELGLNYRMTDLQCALGLSQLSRLDEFIKVRQQIASLYDDFFVDIEGVTPLRTRSNVYHAYHLYVVKLTGRFGNRDEVFRFLRQNKIGVNLHYIPVYLHPFYREKFSYGPGLCPFAELVFSQIITLPLWPGLGIDGATRVVDSLKRFQ